MPRLSSQRAAPSRQRGRSPATLSLGAAPTTSLFVLLAAAAFAALARPGIATKAAAASQPASAVTCSGLSCLNSHALRLPLRGQPQSGGSFAMLPARSERLARTQPQQQAQLRRRASLQTNPIPLQRLESSWSAATGTTNAATSEHRRATPLAAAASAFGKLALASTAAGLGAASSATSVSSKAAAQQLPALRRATTTTPSVAVKAASGRPGDADDIPAAAAASSGGDDGGRDSGGVIAASGATAAAATKVSGMTWRVCGGGPAGAPMLSPDEVTLAPDPPHHGRTMAVNVTGTNPVSTPGGQLRVAVSYMGFKVYTYDSALCDALECPLVAGSPFRLQVSQKLPALAPPGPYAMEITGEDVGGARFMCVQISFHVTLPQPGGGWRGAGGIGWSGGEAEDEQERASGWRE